MAWRPRLRCRARAVWRMPAKSASTIEYAHGSPWLAAVRRRFSASWVVSTVLTRRPQLGSSIDRRRRRRGSALSSSRRPPSASRSWAGMSPWTLRSGTSNQNVAPWPASESTPIWPFISSTMRLEMARPRPVPPYRRVVEASAWLNAWNRRACAAREMPTPVSRTSKRS